MNLTDFSTGIQSLKKDHINRKDYTFSIKQHFNDYKIVFLEGDIDSGKTNLCQEFSFENSKNAISVFFNPLNKIDYNFDFFLTNVIGQLMAYLELEVDNLVLDENLGFENLQRLLIKARRKAKKDKLYFIIDGLEENFQENTSLLKKIIEVLPLGDENINLLITANQREFLKKNDNLDKLNTKSISVLGISDKQVIEYFAFDNIALSNDEVIQLIKITNGFPGRLKVCKKLCESMSVSEIIENEFKKIIELECKKINLEDTNVNVLLSILSLKDYTLGITDFCKILSFDEETFINLVQDMSVLEIQEDSIFFQSVNYKNYFKNKLRANSKKVDDLLISFYSSSDTINSKLKLSELYAENKQWGNLLTMIDETFIANAISTTGSLKKVNDSIELAHMASLESKNASDLLKYSIQGSIINDFENTDILEAEIQARLAIDDLQGAINLAESTLLRLNRLKLLSLIARKEKEQNKNIDEDLINVIITLYKTVDFTEAGEKIYDIVANLMYVLPHLALDIIENSSSKSEENDINEWIIAKLSVASIRSENNSSKEAKQSNEKLIEKVESNNSQKISKAISFLVGNYNAFTVLEEVKKISDSKEKLRLLRIWLSNKKQNSENVEIVIEKALDELISSSSDSILSLEVLKDITLLLPYVKKIGIREKLYSRFVKLDKEMKEIGLEKDKFVYELNLFHTLYTMFKDRAEFKIKDIIKSAESISDKLIRIEVFSEIYIKLVKINKFSFRKSIFEIKEKIKILNNELLINSANHFNISKQYLKTISFVDLEFCLELISDFNTLKNREKSRIHVLNHYLDNNLKHIQLDKLDKLFSEFESSFYKNYFYINILDRFSESKGLHYTIIEYCLKYVNDIDKSAFSFSNKIYCFVQLYKIISKNEQIKYHKNRFIKQKIDDYWNKIDDHWDKVNVGFFVCADLAKIDRAFSINIFTKSETLKIESWISSESTSKTYINSIGIVIKSYIGLTILGINNTTHYKNVETLIDRIPSESERLELWTELCFNLLIENKFELSNSIYNNHVLPLLQGVILRPESFVRCIKALVLTHFYNSDLANDYINEIDDFIKDEIYDSICEFYITNKNPFEIYEGEILNYQCSYNNILKAISVLEKIKTDIYIYNVIRLIQKVVTDRNSIINTTQKTDIVDRLKDIIDTKLPDSKNISHDGYKIVSEIKLVLITKNNSKWQNLYEKSKTVPNYSDRILIKSALLENMPFERLKIIAKSDLFDEIVNDLKKLNNNYEYIERIDAISEVMYNTSKAKWKIIVEEAFAITDKIDKENISFRYQKSLIDTMFRLDSDFAKELLNSIENKDAIKSEFLKDYFMSLEVSKKIKNNLTIEQKEIENSKFIIRGVINTLAALNSGKLSVRRPDEMNKYLNLTYKLPLNESAALYHYYLANCNKHTPPKNLEAKHEEFLNNLFENSIKSTNLIEILATNRKKASINIQFNDFSSNLLLKPGTREEAIKFIQGWINDEVAEFLLFADPFFESKDIEFAKLIKQAGKDNIMLNILSHKYIEKEEIEKEWKRISVENIPYINITFCNIVNESKCPFHDRWIITKNGGLRIGTSFNSLGISRDSEISIISAIESDNIYQTILRGYSERSKREHNFQKIEYKSYTL